MKWLKPGCGYGVGKRTREWLGGTIKKTLEERKGREGRAGAGENRPSGQGSCLLFQKLHAKSSCMLLIEGSVCCDNLSPPRSLRPGKFMSAWGQKN